MPVNGNTYRGLLLVYDHVSRHRWRKLHDQKAKGQTRKLGIWDKFWESGVSYDGTRNGTFRSRRRLLKKLLKI